MKITAIATEDLETKGLDLLKNKIVLTTRGDIFPDTYGKCIGRYDKTTNKYESFFTRDEEAGNTKYFDLYREKCNLYEKHRTVFNREDFSEKQVIDYYVMYDVQESSKNRPTIIEDHVDHSYCVNGDYKCEYELLFACDGAVRRIIFPFTSNNIPMYEIISDLEEMVEEAFEGEADESNPFYNTFTNCDDYCEVTMFDEIGTNCDIEVENPDDFMAMLVSIRLISCEFIEDKDR